ncbi:hypothetical protein BN1318_390018 [Staphylococcus capitis]|nr:hypothetical protein BN1318_390018 [Staphylococcus capitis]
MAKFQHFLKVRAMKLIILKTIAICVKGTFNNTILDIITRGPIHSKYTSNTVITNRTIGVFKLMNIQITIPTMPISMSNDEMYSSKGFLILGLPNTCERDFITFAIVLENIDSE